MTYFREFKIDSDNATGDAFGRLRVSNPTTIFDSKQIFDNQPLFWDDQETSGSGTGSTHSTARASSVLDVSATTAGKRVRQTFQRFNYQPGKSQLVLMTGILDKSGGGTDITRAFGWFDDNNGIFLNDNAGTYQIVRRTSVTGSPVDNAVNQSSWNVDPLDGTGDSGITIDFTKTQIIVIDAEWLGVGRVRVGFNIDGVTYVAHEFLNANTLGAVYMSTANLPLRYEIDNGGTGAASELEHMCSTVISEGGTQDLGVLRHVSTEGTHVDANVANTLYAIVGIRLKTANIGAVINLLNISMIEQGNNDYHWEVYLNPTVAGTFTYSGLTNSSIEYATGATENTVTGGTALSGGMVKSGTSAGTLQVALDNALKLGAAIDGTVDEMVLCCRPLASNADIEGSITFREL